MGGLAVLFSLWFMPQETVVMVTVQASGHKLLC